MVFFRKARTTRFWCIVPVFRTVEISSRPAGQTIPNRRKNPRTYKKTKFLKFFHLERDARIRIQLLGPFPTTRRLF